MKKRFFLVLCVLVLCVLVFPSCDLFAPAPDAPGSIVATPGDESITVTWNASEGATAYDLYYTTDGTVPTLDSTKVTDISAVTYVLSGLSGEDSNKSYIFALAAKMDKKMGALSSATSAVKPLPIITVTFSNGEPNSKIILKILDVPYIAAFDYVDGNTTDQKIVSGTTDATGVAVISASFDRSKYLGYTIAYDVDSSRSITSGDIVRGYGSGSYSYSYWDSLKNTSFSDSMDASDYTWNTY